jgi:hypothetical protein
MKITKLFITLVLSNLLAMSGFAQISPGELSKAHSKLEGVANCTKCHTVGKKVTNEKCLDCHKEIRASIAAKKGFHASADVSSKECFACHNEHHGRKFEIVKLDKKRFDHSKTGFELKGVHAKKDCKECHKSEFISDPILKKKSSTFMGLKGACLTCHTDYHQGKLSPNCATCHNFDSFKNAKVVGFDHNKTHFPILGKHNNVSCSKCHKTEIVNGKTVQRFKGLEFQSCTPCHKDAHETKFGTNCKQCHSEESFHSIKNIATFNHDKTEFQLIGKHKTVACKSCHKTANMTDPLKHDKCSDCHADFHKKEFAKNGITPDCNECHTNNGFGETKFTIERHSKLNFQLEGAHAATPCFACHKKQETWKFRNIDGKCIDCHKNTHKGFMQEKYLANDNCTACHNTTRWKTVKFDHNKTDFKLEGVHARKACAACHYKKNELGVRVQKFQGMVADCSSCHKDSHAGQFEINGKTNCTTCHGFESWSDSKFDHNTSRFKLEGAHVKVSCFECHKETKEGKKKFVQYKFKSIECSTCHS